MSRMPLRPPFLNPESIESHAGLALDNGFASLERQTQMRTWKDSRGERVTRWPQQLLPSATVIIQSTTVWYNAECWCVLVHQRADNGWYGFVGGRQEIGESIEQCATRETYEESGLEVQIERLTSVDSHPEHGSIVAYHDKNVQYTNLTFVAHVIGGTLACSEESTALFWAYTNTLPEPFLPAHLWRLEQAMRAPFTTIPVR